MKNILLIGGCGYIGSYLYERLTQAGFGIEICDIVKSKAGAPIRFAGRYSEISKQELAPFTDILWFAGHSSVGMAKQNPTGALKSNCMDLFDLSQKISSDARLIYASTASLYSTPSLTPVFANESDPIYPKENAYDTSKFAFDYIAQCFVHNYIGLRMGTLCGYSPSLRSELIFNKMNLDAMTTGQISVANPQSFRSILFLSDLYKTVAALLERRTVNREFFNVASLSMTVGDIGERIAKFHGARINELPSSPTYSFQVNTQKAQTLLDMRYDSDFEGQCVAFKEAVTRSRQRQAEAS